MSLEKVVKTKTPNTRKLTMTDGSSRSTDGSTSDPKYRASRAAHYAQVAKDAVIAHGKTKTESEKTVHEAAASHAAQRAGVHARFVTKTLPGSELADEATHHAEVAKTVYEKLKITVADDRENAKKEKEDKK